MNVVHDVVIIGAGPAGLTAGLYCARGGLDTLILDRVGAGGQMVWCDNVENYPGVPAPITGMELTERMRAQAEGFGARLEVAEVSRVSVGQPINIALGDGRLLACRALIVATGGVPRRLGVPGEKELTGKGVSYCATCDAAFFRGREVIVVGGGDTAAQEALFLARFCRKVTVVHRRDRLRAAHVLRQRLAAAADKVGFIWKSRITAIEGNDKVIGVVVEDINSGTANRVPCDGVFIFVGQVPASGFLRGVVAMDSEGHIVTDEEMRTSTPGIFACGDVRRKLLRQVVTACGDGALAAESAQRYIEGLPSLSGG